MADRHDIADITEQETGNLQLIIFLVRCSILTENDQMINDTDNDTGNIGDCTSHHKFPVFVKNQKTDNRKNVGKGNR